MTRYDNYNDYSYGVLKWTGWETYDLENVMRITYKLQLSQDGYPYDYCHYWNECLAMRMKAFNELLECRNYTVPGMKGIDLFLGDYAFHEMKEDGADCL